MLIRAMNNFPSPPARHQQVKIFRVIGTTKLSKQAHTTIHQIRGKCQRPVSAIKAIISLAGHSKDGTGRKFSGMRWVPKKEIKFARFQKIPLCGGDTPMHESKNFTCQQILQVRERMASTVRGRYN